MKVRRLLAETISKDIGVNLEPDMREFIYNAVYYSIMQTEERCKTFFQGQIEERRSIREMKELHAHMEDYLNQSFRQRNIKLCVGLSESDQNTLTEPHVTAIRRNSIKLKENLNLEGTLLLDRLIEKDVLSEAGRRSILSRRTPLAQNSALLDHVTKTFNETSFRNIFMPALEKEHDPLSKELQRDLDFPYPIFPAVRRCNSCYVKSKISIRKFANRLHQSGIIDEALCSDLVVSERNQADRWNLIVKKLRKNCKAVMSVVMKFYEPLFQLLKKTKSSLFICTCHELDTLTSDKTGDLDVARLSDFSSDIDSVSSPTIDTENIYSDIRYGDFANLISEHMYLDRGRQPKFDVKKACFTSTSDRGFSSPTPTTTSISKRVMCTVDNNMVEISADPSKILKTPVQRKQKLAGESDRPFSSPTSTTTSVSTQGKTTTSISKRVMCTADNNMVEISADPSKFLKIPVQRKQKLAGESDRPFSSPTSTTTSVSTQGKTTTSISKRVMCTVDNNMVEISADPSKILKIPVQRKQKLAGESDRPFSSPTSTTTSVSTQGKTTTSISKRVMCTVDNNMVEISADPSKILKIPVQRKQKLAGESDRPFSSPTSTTTSVSTQGKTTTPISKRVIGDNNMVELPADPSKILKTQVQRKQKRAGGRDRPFSSPTSTTTSVSTQGKTTTSISKRVIGDNNMVELPADPSKILKTQVQRKQKRTGELKKTHISRDCGLHHSQVSGEPPMKKMRLTLKSSPNTDP